MTSSNHNEPFVAFLHSERRWDDFNAPVVIDSEEKPPRESCLTIENLRKARERMEIEMEVSRFDSVFIIESSAADVLFAPEPKLGPRPNKGNLNAFLMKKQKRRY